MGPRKLRVVAFSVLNCSSLSRMRFRNRPASHPQVLSFAPQVVNLISPGSQPQTIYFDQHWEPPTLIVSSVLASGGYTQDQ